ncbi:MAG: tetratricopeptide repeat protein, partial [Chloroflexi bacterium]|nr:tetratricopeptide repeat protein [Chloroflexota bacterium]
ADVNQVRIRCERALELLPAQELGLRAQAYHTLGIGLTRHGNYAAASAPWERALELAQLANERGVQADAEHDLGNLYVIMGDRRRGQRHLENALRQIGEPDHPTKRAITLNTIAVLLYRKGELERAAELLREALADVRNTGHLRTEAYVLASLGEVERDRGHSTEALQYFTASSELAEKIHESFLLSFTRVAIGDLWRASGDLGTAERVLQSALQTAMAQRADYPLALVQLALGALKLELHELDAAQRHLEHAAKVFQAASEMRQLGRAQVYRARLALLRKQESQAVEHLRQVASLGRLLEEEQFLCQDLVGARALLELALKRRVAPTFYRRLLDATTKTASTERALFAVKEETLPRLDIFALGIADVQVDSILLDRGVWQTATTKELFFFFLTHPQGWRKEELLEHLWQDVTRAQGNDLFHSSVYRIRRALFPECLVFSHGLYQFNPEVVYTLDAHQFEAALDEARQVGDLAQKRAVLEQAVALYHGDYLNEIYADWCVARREHLRTRFLDALATLAQCCVDLGDARQALHVYQELLRQDPLREATYRDLMGLYVMLGDRAAALQTYRRCVEQLQTELGVLPMPETEALFQQLKLG